MFRVNNRSTKHHSGFFNFEYIRLFADLEHINAGWDTLLPYKSNFINPFHISDEALYNNSQQHFPAITNFCYKELHLRCCIILEICNLIYKNSKRYQGGAAFRKFDKLTLLNALKIYFTLN